MTHYCPHCYAPVDLDAMYAEVLTCKCGGRYTNPKDNVLAALTEREAVDDSLHIAIQNYFCTKLKKLKEVTDEKTE